MRLIITSNNRILDCSLLLSIWLQNMRVWWSHKDGHSDRWQKEAVPGWEHCHTFCCLSLFSTILRKVLSLPLWMMKLKFRNVSLPEAHECLSDNWARFWLWGRSILPVPSHCLSLQLRFPSPFQHCLLYPRQADIFSVPLQESRCGVQDAVSLREAQDNMPELLVSGGRAGTPCWGCYASILVSHQ